MTTASAQIGRSVQVQSRIEHVGGLLARYGLVVVIAWISACKFTAYEAQGIQPLVANSPLMSWLYEIFSVDTFSWLLGVGVLAISVWTLGDALRRR